MVQIIDMKYKQSNQECQVQKHLLGHAESLVTQVYKENPLKSLEEGRRQMPKVTFFE